MVDHHCNVNAMTINPEWIKGWSRGVTNWHPDHIHFCRFSSRQLAIVASFKLFQSKIIGLGAPILQRMLDHVSTIKSSQIEYSCELALLPLDVAFIALPTCKFDHRGLCSLNFMHYWSFSRKSSLHLYFELRAKNIISSSFWMFEMCIYYIL